MGYSTPDWQQPATIASGVVTVVSASQAEPRAAQSVSRAAPYTVPVSPGRTVVGYLLHVVGAVAGEYSVDAGATWQSLPAGMPLSFSFSGSVRVRSASATQNATFDLTVFEV